VLEPAEHATVVVGIVGRVEARHLLAQADLEVLELPQQVCRDDRLAQRVLTASEFPEVGGIGPCVQVWTVLDFLCLGLMFDLGSLAGISFEIQNPSLFLNFL
jgi:hypothetical protein